MDRLTPAPLVLDAGQPWPLGVHWDGAGLNIAVTSSTAQAIELCLFDADGQRVGAIGIDDPPAPRTPIARVVQALVQLAPRRDGEVDDLDLCRSGHRTASFSQA